MEISKTISKKSNHLGISISSNTVYAVGLDTHQTITFSDSISSEVSYFINDEVNIEELTKTLKMFVEKYGKGNRNAAICFPERLAYSREHTLPKLKISEIDEAIKWQISTIFPLQADDIYIDWKLLSQNDTETKVVVVAVSRKFLDDLQTACVAAGLRPMSFEPSACTLARAQKDQSKTHIILEIDGFGSSASLIENGVSSLTTTCAFATDQTLDQIISEINTSLQNLLYHQQTVTPDVYLTGEKAAPKLAELLANTSHLPVSLLSLPTTSPGLHLPYLAALSVLMPPESELSINLLPKNLQDQYLLETNIEASKKTTTLGLVLGSVCMIATICFCIMSIMMRNNLTKEMATASTGDTTVPPIDMVQTMKKAQLINQISPLKQTVPTKQIQALEEAGVKIDQIKKLTFDTTHKQLQMTLSDVSRDNIYLMKNNLEKTQMFSSISVPLTTFSTDSNPQTTITMIVK